MSVQVNLKLAGRVLKVVDAGLVRGMGNPKPGQMCVEAAVCYAMGMPHGDNPSCVGAAVRAFKIALNDSFWSSEAARAAGLRRIAVAQLGSKDIDQVAFSRALVREAIRRVLPIALRAAGSLVPSCATALENAALRCEEDPTIEAASAASYAASFAASAAASSKVLVLVAECGITALRECGCVGVALMDELAPLEAA